MRTLAMPMNAPDKTLTEGHPVLISKVIQGDLRTKSWTVDGVPYSSQNNDGTLLYDKSDIRDRPWFVLIYESGRRIVD